MTLPPCVTEKFAGSHTVLPPALLSTGTQPNSKGDSAQPAWWFATGAAWRFCALRKRIVIAAAGLSVAGSVEVVIL